MRNFQERLVEVTKKITLLELNWSECAFGENVFYENKNDKRFIKFSSSQFPE